MLELPDMPPMSVAGACCAHLLCGIPVNLNHGNRPGVPAIVVSEGTQALICDVLQRPELFRDVRPIERRIVAWGRAAEPVTLPHSAVVLPEMELVRRLHLVEDAACEEAEWTIFTSRPLPAGVTEHHFGSRKAAAIAVDMKTPDAPTCWVESLENGWLFLVPGVLIAVGGAPEALLAESRLVAREILAVTGEASEFLAYPRIADPLCAPGWLACGSAAMAFDPICGDGTGNAVREAILAAAVIRAAARGGDVEGLLAHYRSRLIAGFHRHLELTLAFYRGGHGGAWWDEEVRALERGAAWCARELAAAPAFHYRLNGFDLEPAAGA